MTTGFGLVQVITLSVAVLGAVLGIINTWQGLDKSLVKLKVLPAHVSPPDLEPNGSMAFCIEVTNLSAFPVVIREAGFFFKQTKNRLVIDKPTFNNGGTWPMRLEPRSALTVYCSRPESTQRQTIKCAYATTECGHTKRGTSPALKGIVSGSVDEFD